MTYDWNDLASADHTTLAEHDALCHHEQWLLLTDARGIEIWTFDTGEYDSAGRSRLAYRLDWIRGTDPRRRDTVFIGADFHSHGPVDGTGALIGLLGFLTLRPGDTDDEYFDDYTPLQRDWAESYACEALGAETRGIEEGEWSLPSIEAACERANVEVFEESAEDVRQHWEDNDRQVWGDEDGPLDGGWFYWCCLPGCLPQSDPFGPFETCREAVEDAFETFSLWDQ